MANDKADKPDKNEVELKALGVRIDALRAQIDLIWTHMNKKDIK